MRKWLMLRRMLLRFMERRLLRKCQHGFGPDMLLQPRWAEVFKTAHRIEEDRSAALKPPACQEIGVAAGLESR